MVVPLYLLSSSSLSALDNVVDVSINHKPVKICDQCFNSNSEPLSVIANGVAIIISVLGSHAGDHDVSAFETGK